MTGLKPKEHDAASRLFQNSGSGWRHNLPKALNGAGFLVLSFYLIFEVGLKEAGIVLLILCLAEASSSICISLALWCSEKPHVKNSAKAEDFGTNLFWITTSFLALTLLSNFWGVVSAFREFQFSIQTFTLITVSLVYIKSSGLFINSISRRALQPRFVIFTLLIIPLPLGSGFDLGQAFIKLAAGFVIISIFLFIRRRGHMKFRRISKNETFPKLIFCQNPLELTCRSFDLIIVPFLFDIKSVAVFLIARGLAYSIALGLSMFGNILENSSDSIQKSTTVKSITILAARLNLAIFFIGSGIAIGTLATGKLLAPVFESSQPIFLSVLLWCVARYSSKAVFGTYEDILILKGMKVISDAFNLASLSGLLLYFFLLPMQTIENFSMVLAISHLLPAALSAGIVAIRYGIWPGPTAIFFRQIKLL